MDIMQKLLTIDMARECFQEIERLREKLKEYEDAEEQGRLYISPLQIGDTVFITPHYRAYWKDIEETKVTGVALHPPAGSWYIATGIGLDCPSYNIGKTVFLTREEAEARLKGVNSDR